MINKKGETANEGSYKKPWERRNNTDSRHKPCLKILHPLGEAVCRNFYADLSRNKAFSKLTESLSFAYSGYIERIGHMKKNIACQAAVIALMFLTACTDATKDDNLFAGNDLSASSEYNISSDVTSSAKQNYEDIAEENDNVIYKSSNVVVTESEPLETPNIVCNLWDMPTEPELYNDCDIVADVTIKSSKEVVISYTFMGAECTSYKTLANVSVNKEYYSADENISQEFTVAIPNSSYAFDEDFPEIAAGGRCILFISDTEGPDDSLELDKYADHYLSSPANIININGSECQANKIFASYSTNAVSVPKELNVDLQEGEVLISDEDVISSEQYTMPFADFENTLITKINERSGMNRKLI